MIRPRTLLERLAEAGNPGQGFSDTTVLRRSILANLRRILNTRPGSVPACPQLGIPPPHELASRWPAAREAVLAQIRQAITAGEPRLAAVEVGEASGGDPAILRLRLTATLADGSRQPFVCDTTFNPVGRVETGA